MSVCSAAQTPGIERFGFVSPSRTAAGDPAGKLRPPKITTPLPSESLTNGSKVVAADRPELVQPAPVAANVPSASLARSASNEPKLPDATLERTLTSHAQWSRGNLRIGASKGRVCANGEG